MQTPEERIRLHHKSLKKTSAMEKLGPNWKWLTLAKIHGRPVREIKDIVKGEQK